MPSYFPSSVARSFELKFGERLTIKDFNAVGDGSTDDGVAFNNAIADAAAAGGADILVPRGTYNIVTPIVVESTHSNIRFIGENAGACVLQRGTAIGTGTGLINIYGSNIQFIDLTIDGQVGTATQLQYGGFSDPLEHQLSHDTSIWIHGGASNITIAQVAIKHTGGYAILGDATTGDISNLIIAQCLFENNRPHTFGTNTTDLSYGAWTGGILFEGDGTSYSVRGATIDNNTFRRVNGNCIWQHLYAFGRLHTRINITNNIFEDIGRDAILVGGVFGGLVTHNTIRRVGYIHTTDNDTPAPKYLPGQYAVGIDCSGMVVGVDISNNSITSVNGGFIDLDGFSNGVVGNNVCFAPRVGDAEYTEDQCAQWGTASTNISYGIQPSNTSNNIGAENVTIVNNVVINCSAGAIRAFAARGGYIANNSIWHPADAVYPPIGLGHIGTATTQRTTRTVITGNNIYYDPVTPVPAVFEDASSTGYAFTTSDINWVQGNYTAGNCYEFKKDANSASVTAAKFPSNQNALSTNEQSTLQREGAGVTAALKLYDTSSTTTKQLAQWQPSNAWLNIGDGSAGTGGIATGDRTSAAYDDLVWTGKQMADAFIAVYDKDGTAGSYSDADANLLNADWALLRYNKAINEVQVSTSTASSTRVWGSLGGGGGSLSGLTAGRIPYTLTATSIGDTANLLWDNANSILKLTGTAFVGTSTADGSGAILQVTGFGNASVGWSAQSTNTDAIKAPNGGVTSKYIIATQSLNLVGVSQATAGLSNAGQLRIICDSSNSYNPYISVNGGAYMSLIGSSGITGLTSTRIPYATSATTLADSANLTWDNANSKVIINGVLQIGASYLGIPAKLSVIGPVYVITNSATQYGLVIAGAAAQTYNLLELRDNAANSLLSVGPDGVLYIASSHASTSSTAYGSYGSDGIQFKQTAGDEVSCGRIVYRGFGTGALTIVGCGTTSSTRLVYLFDVTIIGTKLLVARTTDDSSGAVLQLTGFGNSSTGWATSGSATDALKATNGGVTVKWLIGTQSLSLNGTTQAAAGLSNAGSLRIICDQNNSYNAYISVNGGAYSLLTGGSGLGYSSLSSGRIPYTDSSSSVTSTSNLVWDNSNKRLTVVGNSGQIGIYSQTGYIQSDGGLYSSVASDEAVKLTYGKLAARGVAIYRADGGGTGYDVVINTSGQFVGPGINVGNNGISGSGYNVYGGYTGQTWDVYGSFTINSVSYTRLIFRGGVLVSAA